MKTLFCSISLNTMNCNMRLCLAGAIIIFSCIFGQPGSSTSDSYKTAENNNSDSSSFTERDDVLEYISNTLIPGLSTRRIMNAAQIKNFNLEIRRRGYVVNPLHRDFRLTKKQLSRFITYDKNYLRENAKYDISNTLIPKSHRLAEFEKNMNIAGIPEYPTRSFKSGVIISPALIRLAPSMIYRMTMMNDYFFDAIQISFLNIGETVMVIHQSMDKEWLLVQSAHSRGWIKKIHFAQMSRKEIEKMNSSTKFIVVTGNRTLITDQETSAVFPLFMGTRLAYESVTNDMFQISLGSKKFTVPKNSNIETDYPSLTQKNIAAQAFRMRGEKYSWGGLDGDTDCSGYIARVYASFGIILPRGSIRQFSVFEQGEIINNGFVDHMVPFLTLIRIHGHIMIYAGQLNDQPLIMHNVWKYFDDKNTKQIIGRTVVTGMDLGKNSREGTIMSRVLGFATLPGLPQSAAALCLEEKR